LSSNPTNGYTPALENKFYNFWYLEILTSRHPPLHWTPPSWYPYIGLYRQQKLYNFMSILYPIHKCSQKFRTSCRTQIKTQFSDLKSKILFVNNPNQQPCHLHFIPIQRAASMAQNYYFGKWKLFYFLSADEIENMA